MDLRAQLLQARKRLKRSQVVVAEETGLGEATIQRLERGLPTHPSTRLLIEMWLIRNTQRQGDAV